MRLGIVHAGLMLLLVLVTSLFARDELANWKMIDGQVDAATVAANMPWDAITVAALVYVPDPDAHVVRAATRGMAPAAGHKGAVLLALCMLAQQVAVPRAGAGVRRTRRCRVVALSLLLNMLGVSPQLGSMLLAPIALALTSVAYSTQYPIYRAVLEPPSILTPIRASRLSPHAGASLATASASHLMPCGPKLTCARASSPLPSRLMTTPSPKRA